MGWNRQPDNHGLNGHAGHETPLTGSPSSKLGLGGFQNGFAGDTDEKTFKLEATSEIGFFSKIRN